MKRVQVEHVLNIDQALVAELFACMSMDRLYDLDDAIYREEPIEHFFADTPSDRALRRLASSAVIREIWRRMEVAEMESAEGRLS